jgi:hypothetical protein
MNPQTDGVPYLIATTESGILIIHSLPITLSWVPRDTLNDALNVGGILTIGTFDSLEEAKRAAAEQYPVLAEDWQVSDTLPFDAGGRSRTEIHTPEIEGHDFVRHGTRRK